jgi:hypothetical protein
MSKRKRETFPPSPEEHEMGLRKEIERLFLQIDFMTQDLDDKKRKLKDTQAKLAKLDAAPQELSHFAAYSNANDEWTSEGAHCSLSADAPLGVKIFHDHVVGDYKLNRDDLTAAYDDDWARIVLGLNGPIALKAAIEQAEQ